MFEILKKDLYKFLKKMSVCLKIKFLSQFKELGLKKLNLSLVELHLTRKKLNQKKRKSSKAKKATKQAYSKPKTTSITNQKGLRKKLVASLVVIEPISGRF